MEVLASATTASKQTLQAKVSFEVVHPPVLLIHGIWSNSEAWALGEKLLEAWGFRYVSRYNYSSCNSCDPATRIEPNLTRQIQDPENGFLARVEKDKTLASRYDLVGHSLGGLVARQHVVTGDNYKQVRKVVTVGTPHLGSEFADWYLYFERNKTQNDKEQNAPNEVVNHPNWQSGPSGRNWDNDEFDWLKDQVRTTQELDPTFFVDGLAVDALRPRDALPASAEETGSAHVDCRSRIAWSTWTLCYPPLLRPMRPPTTTQCSLLWDCGTRVTD